MLKSKIDKATNFLSNESKGKTIRLLKCNIVDAKTRKGVPKAQKPFSKTIFVGAKE